MCNILTGGGAGVLLLIIGHAHSAELTCPAVTQIHRALDSVIAQDNREWQSLIDVGNPALLQFNGAEFVIPEATGDEQAPTRATITCKYGSTPLTLEYLPAQGPATSPWLNNHCERSAPPLCKLMNTDDFNLSF